MILASIETIFHGKETPVKSQKEETNSDLSPTGRMTKSEPACQMAAFTKALFRHDFNIVGTQTGRYFSKRPYMEEVERVPKKA